MKQVFAVKDQRAINIVDLMMWMVVAALLMAVAMQGASYYKNGAYVYQMKNDIRNVVDLSAALGTNSGTIEEDELEQAVAESQKSPDVTITWFKASEVSYASGDTDYGFDRVSAVNASVPALHSDATQYILKASHPAVPDILVYYLFKKHGPYESGMVVGNAGTFPTTAPEGATTPSDTSTVGGTPVTCGSATYTPVGNIDLHCEMLGGDSWGGHLMQHRLTLTPNTNTLTHWQVQVDMSGITTLESIKASGPTGYDPYIDGVPSNNALFKKFTFLAEGNPNDNPPESSQNFWYSSIDKGQIVLEFEITY